MTSWVYTAGSWGCVSLFVVLGWAYYRHNDGDKPKRIGRKQSDVELESVLKDVQQQEEGKPKQKKKAKKPAISGQSLGAVNGAAVPAPAVKPAESVLQQRKQTHKSQIAKSSSIDPNPVPPQITKKETDTDNFEFAQRMVKAKNGASLSTEKKQKQQVRTQKQSKMNGSLESSTLKEEITSSGTSNTGDADDDLSSINSPAFSAITSPADTTGIADMLETAASGPASLRITEPLIPVKAKEKPVKKEIVVETKKQRQKRLQREREREANRELEAKRKVLEERQRRTAREAEGRLPKNGNGWTYASGLPANAWSSGAIQQQAQGQVPAQVPANAQAAVATYTDLLDTVELPSEEEQMRLIQEQNEASEWTTVAKRGKRTESSTASSSGRITPTLTNGKSQNYYPAGFSSDD